MLEALDHFREEGILNVRDNHAQRLACILRQIARVQIGDIVQVSNRREDGSAGRPAHPATVIQDVGNGCDRDACGFSYITDGDGLHLWKIIDGAPLTELCLTIKNNGV